MARPYWSGQSQISLVSFSVSLFVATESKSAISFHQISRSTGERVRHQKVLQSAVDNPGEEAGPAVTKDEIVKGYEYTVKRLRRCPDCVWLEPANPRYQSIRVGIGEELHVFGVVRHAIHTLR